MLFWFNLVCMQFKSFLQTFNDSIRFLESQATHTSSACSTPSSDQKCFVVNQELVEHLATRSGIYRQVSHHRNNR